MKLSVDVETPTPSGSLADGELPEAGTFSFVFSPDMEPEAAGARWRGLEA